MYNGQFFIILQNILYILFVRERMRKGKGKEGGRKDLKTYFRNYLHIMLKVYVPIRYVVVLYSY